jgi:hypothetical protein
MAVRVLFLVMTVLAVLYGCGQDAGGGQKAGWPPPVGEQVRCSPVMLEHKQRCDSVKGFDFEYVYYCEVFPADVKGVPERRGGAGGGSAVPIEGSRLKAGKCSTAP